jgi:hypothetical protein
MILNETHLEAIRAAALHIDYGSITINSGSGDHLDITVEKRMRFPKEPETNKRPPLLRPAHGHN